MSARLVWSPKHGHECQLPTRTEYESGSIIVCLVCGRRYEATELGAAYRRLPVWTRTWRKRRLARKVMERG